MPTPLFGDHHKAAKALSGRSDVFEQLQCLWATYQPFADDDFLREMRGAIDDRSVYDTPCGERTAACHRLHRRWWEMCTAYALLEQGIKLIPRGDWDDGNGGPDLLAIVGDKKIWVECVAPDQGSGPDRVQDAPLGVCSDVPVAQIQLRLLSAIRNKREQHDRHKAAQIISDDDGYVVALNGWLACGHCPIDGPIPWIVCALYGLGSFAVDFDLSGGGRSDPYLTRQRSLWKQNNSPITADMFGNGEARELSGVIYSLADAWNLSSQPSRTMLMVHNRTAIMPLPVNWLSEAETYTVSVKGKTGTVTCHRPAGHELA